MGDIASGAGHGALTGATVGSVVPGVGTVVGGAVGALVGGVGGWLSGRSKRNKEKEQARLAREAAIRLWDTKEQQRIALLKGLQAQAGARGPKVAALLQGLDPSLFQARPYAGPEIGKESGESVTGDILGGVVNAAGAIGDYSAQKKAETTKKNQEMNFLCAVYPTLPDCMGGPAMGDVSVGG